MPEAEKKVVAICVCTSGVRDSFHACVTSLLAQQVPEHISSVLVIIDNSADGNVEGICGLKKEKNQQLVFSREPNQGIPYARNQAIIESINLEASYIAFIDDDEIAPKDWLGRLIAGLEKNEADVIVGEVARCESLKEAEMSAVDFQHSKVANLNQLQEVKTAVTSNVLFKTDLVQPPLNLRFDENMVFGGSDREFFMQVSLTGHKMVAAKTEIVFEAWPAERREIAYLLMRWLRYGVSFNYRYSKNLSPLKAYLYIWLMFFYKLLGAPIKFLTIPVRIVWDKRPIRRLIGMAVANVAFAIGCVAPMFGLKLKKYY